jgi:hypothetical protein
MGFDCRSIELAVVGVCLSFWRTQRKQNRFVLTTLDIFLMQKDLCRCQVRMNSDIKKSLIWFQLVLRL